MQVIALMELAGELDAEDQALLFYEYMETISTLQQSCAWVRHPGWH